MTKQVSTSQSMKPQLRVGTCKWLRVGISNLLKVGFFKKAQIPDKSEVQIDLRPASSTDEALLRHWDEQPHVLASDPNDDWGWEIELDRIVPWREQLIAQIDGRPIGFVQIIDPAREDSHYWGDVAANLRAIDIWIGEETDLGKGYGTKMMQLALVRCFNDPLVTGVLVDPLANNTRAHRFYERLGFQFVEQRRFGNDDCFVYLLTRADWHHSYLALASQLSDSQ